MWFFLAGSAKAVPIKRIKPGRYGDCQGGLFSRNWEISGSFFRNSAKNRGGSAFWKQASRSSRRFYQSFRVDDQAFILNLPRQHFLYFRPLPQGHGSFRLAVGITFVVSVRAICIILSNGSSARQRLASFNR